MNETSLSPPPEFLTLKALGEAMDSVGERDAGERINEIEDALEMGDVVARRSSESSRSRRSFTRVDHRDTR